MSAKYLITLLFGSFMLIYGQETGKKGYGKFTIKVTSYNVTVSENMKSSVIIRVAHHEHKNGTFELSLQGRVLKTLDTIGIKLRQSTWNEEKRMFFPTFNMAIRNICEHNVARELITMVDGLDKNCRVKPGSYNFTIRDLDAYTHLLTSGKFFYGTYLTLTDVFAGKTRRILRSNVTAIVKPID